MSPGHSPCGLMLLSRIIFELHTMNSQSIAHREFTTKLFLLGRLFSSPLVAILAIITLAYPAHGQPAAVSYDSLTEGKAIHGFKTVAIYLNDSDKPMGARF